MKRTNSTSGSAIHPPRTHEATAGEAPLRIVARQVERPDEVAAELGGRLRVEPFDDLDAVLDTLRGAGHRSGSYQLRAHNRGNHPAAARFTLVDQDQELEFTPTAQEWVLDPGEAAEVPVRVKARRRRWVGAARYAALPRRPRALRRTSRSPAGGALPSARTASGVGGGARARAVGRRRRRRRRAAIGRRR